MWSLSCLKYNFHINLSVARSVLHIFIIWQKLPVESKNIKAEFGPGQVGYHARVEGLLIDWDINDFFGFDPIGAWKCNLPPF